MVTAGHGAPCQEMIPVNATLHQVALAIAWLPTTWPWGLGHGSLGLACHLLHSPRAVFLNVAPRAPAADLEAGSLQIDAHVLVDLLIASPPHPLVYGLDPPPG